MELLCLLCNAYFKTVYTYENIKLCTYKGLFLYTYENIKLCTYKGLFLCIKNITLLNLN